MNINLLLQSESLNLIKQFERYAKSELPMPTITYLGIDFTLQESGSSTQNLFTFKSTDSRRLIEFSYIFKNGFIDGFALNFLGKLGHKAHSSEAQNYPTEETILFTQKFEGGNTHHGFTKQKTNILKAEYEFTEAATANKKTVVINFVKNILGQISCAGYFRGDISCSFFGDNCNIEIPHSIYTFYDDIHYKLELEYIAAFFCFKRIGNYIELDCIAGAKEKAIDYLFELATK